MESVLNTYTGEEDETVADLLANVIDDLLGPSGFGILSKGKNVNVTYYEHIENRTVPSASYDKAKDYKSLMWTIPFGANHFNVHLYSFAVCVELDDSQLCCPPLPLHLSGQDFPITLPELDFQLDGALPLQLKVDSEPPVLTIGWVFTLAFGELELCI